MMAFGLLSLFMQIYFCESFVDTSAYGGIISFMDIDSLDTLTWDDCYPIAKRLQELHPGVCLEDVSLMILYQWTISLPEFSDDPDLVNESILLSILQEWFEEANPL